jgi:hypothetical protein
MIDKLTDDFCCHFRQGDEVARLAVVQQQQNTWLPSREQLFATLTLISSAGAFKGVTAHSAYGPRHPHQRQLAAAGVKIQTRDNTRFIDYGLRALSSSPDELETKGYVRVLSHEAVMEKGSEYLELMDLLDSFWEYQTCTEFAL